MNPPTIGHEKLLNVLARKAGSNPYRVFLSQSQDSKKNPLGYAEKTKLARKMFPKHARSILMDKKVKTVFNAVQKLYNEGYKNVVMVVGQDRVREFDILLNKYNAKKGPHGIYNFSRIDVVSAGERDPDSDSVTGMSASKMRKAAADKDFTAFSQGLPKQFQMLMRSHYIIKLDQRWVLRSNLSLKTMFNSNLFLILEKIIYKEIYIKLVMT